jgi:hypothetical protein
MIGGIASVIRVGVGPDHLATLHIHPLKYTPKPQEDSKAPLKKPLTPSV